jgi:hypothetical protein
MVRIETLDRRGGVTRLERDVHAELACAPRQECADGTPCGAFEQRGVLPADTTTFGRRGSGRQAGGPSDGFGFRSLIYVQAAAVVQHGSLVEDAWEREEEGEWMGHEGCEYRVRRKWGGVPRSQRCREFEGAFWSVQADSDQRQCYTRVVMEKRCADGNRVCTKAIVEWGHVESAREGPLVVKTTEEMRKSRS